MSSSLETFEADVPRMSWLFEAPSRQKPRLLHGAAVEIFDDGFFEGCYAGPWADGAFDQVEHVFGSGMRRRRGVLWFTPPSHTLEALYVYRHPGGYAVSNSLAFLVGYCHLALPFHIHYGGLFASAVLGIDDYESVITQGARGQVSRVMFDNFRIDDDGRIIKARKPDTPEFSGFAGYKQALLGVLASAFANAEDPSRRSRFTPLSTCSSGYDSSTCAALAAELGCKDIITLREARHGQEDSGRAVGEALGMHVIEVERTARAEESSDVVPFLASGMGAEDYCFRGFEPSLPGRVLLTGFHGDKVWDLSTRPNAVLRRGDMSGSSLQEYRQRVGFCHIPVPMIGARKHSSIHRIAGSDEMRPFRIGGPYDRPIPRRIVEEAGVARTAFGQMKKAASLLLLWDSSLMSNELKAELRRARQRMCPTARSRLAYAAGVVVWQTRQMLYRLLKKVPGMGGVARRVVADWQIFASDPPLSSVAFLMAIEALRARYADLRSEPRVP